MAQKRQILAIEFLWLALYGFAAFSLELLQGLMIKLSTGASNLLTALLWLIAATALIYLAKTKFAFDIFKIKAKLNNQTQLFFIICVCGIILLTTIGFGGFKPWMEFTGEANRQIGPYLSRIVYYLAESLLILITISFAQEFFDRRFQLPTWLPTGGIFLAATWGSIHFFLQGISGGLYTMAFSLIAGLIYLAAKKDARWSYFYIALAFIL
ncbi:hypothetical protein ACYSNU_16880 [Enterococcus sp. LJL120]